MTQLCAYISRFTTHSIQAKTLNSIALSRMAEVVDGGLHKRAAASAAWSLLLDPHPVTGRKSPAESVRSGHSLGAARQPSRPGGRQRLLPQGLQEGQQTVAPDAVARLIGVQAVGVQGSNLLALGIDKAGRQI